MKIVSPFHDYYDAGQTWDPDDGRVYERKPRAELLPPDPWPYDPVLKTLLTEHRLPVAVALLLVAGRVWPLFGRDPISPYGVVHLPETIPEHGYTDLQGLAELFRADLDSPHRHRRDAAEAFFGDDPKRKFGHDRALTRAAATAFAHEVAGSEAGESLLVAIGAPVALLVTDPEGGPGFEDIAALANVRLADVNFASVLDPHACYGAVATFVRNQLAETDDAPIRTGTDEDLARAKGFDGASFRTPAPGPKRETRAANRQRKKGG